MTHARHSAGYAGTEKPRQSSGGTMARSAAKHSAGVARDNAGYAQRAASDTHPGLFDGWRQRRARKKARLDKLSAAQLRVYKKRKKQRLKRIIGRTLLSILTVLGVILISLLCVLFVVFHGPSQSLGDVVTVTMLETSALKFVPHLYYSNDTVEAIVARNSIAAPSEDTDPSLINIDTSAAQAAETTEEYKDIEVFEVSGGTYHGYMMVVHDPSRVSVGVCRKDFNKEPGLQLYEIAEKYGAVAAVNGGLFDDAGGVGNGGMPGGVVISEGELLAAHGSGVTAGFDQNDVLVVGEMSGKKAQELGLRDAVTFGPALVINGEACDVSGISSGLNPRTAIGQREDGAVLLLVIDGRQVNSLGATHADLMRVMLEYGAVNACNLDGGSSSIMYYNGEYLNNGVMLTGSRRIPTAFIVR